MTEKSTIIKFRSSPELKAKLSTEAKKRGVNESELLRSLIVGLSETPPEKVTLPIETEIHRLTLRLPKILLNSAKIKADKKGMTLTKWIESLIQVAITKNTVFSEIEFIALKESNRNLLAIGRNLNQLTKAFNSGLQFSFERKLLDELEEMIKENSNRIHSCLKASHNPWGEE